MYRQCIGSMMSGKRIFEVVCLSLLLSLVGCSGTPTEQDLGSVKTISVAGKTWMAENLSVSYFRNGDPIPEVTNDADWRKAGEQGRAAWCYYNNDSKNGEVYGRLYNWFAVTDPRGLAPEGWHVPSDDEWTALTDELGGKAGTIMKSRNWAAGQGTDESGFNALPGGNRNHDGGFHLLNNYAVWWSATGAQGNFAWFRFVTSANGIVGRDYSNRAKGLAVRLVKD
jgi:uncharacterized protein (TIGR02145 family)